MHVLADLVVAGEQAVVGVRARSPGVVVTRTEMTVASNPTGLAAHDQCEFGVRLITHHPVHDVCSGFLQAVGQFDVGFLIESGAQLDDDRDVLASVGRCYERIDDRRLVARAVQRLFDRQHLRIRRGLAQEIHYRRETLIRMVQQHVVLPDGGEQIRRQCEAFGQARREDGVLEVGPLHQVIDRREAIEIHRSGHAVGVNVMQGELALQKLHHVLRAVPRCLQSHGRAVPPMRELALEGAPQVIDFFLVDEQIAVACDPELVTTQHLDAGEQLLHERLDDAGEQHQSALRTLQRNRHDAWQ